MPGITVQLPWPTVYQTLNAGGVIMYSIDPDDHYRPWLEENCGRQGWDWDWRVLYQRDVFRLYNQSPHSDDVVEVKFRKGKESIAVLAKLRWL